MVISKTENDREHFPFSTEDEHESIRVNSRAVLSSLGRSQRRPEGTKKEKDEEKRFVK